MSPKDVIDLALTNEPAKAVETMQELIRARAKELVAQRYYPEAQAQAEAE